MSGKIMCTSFLTVSIDTYSKTCYIAVLYITKVTRTGLLQLEELKLFSPFFRRFDIYFSIHINTSSFGIRFSGILCNSFAHFF